MTLALIQNTALLVSLIVIQQTVGRYWHGTARRKAVMGGVVFGLVTIVGMTMPLQVQGGVIIDGRSIILSVAGLFGGPISAIIAAVFATAFRLYLGGAGAPTGLLVIMESTALGIIAHHIRKHDERIMTVWGLWAFGLVVHLAMLATQFALPNDLGPHVVRELWPVLLGLYPLGSLLVCTLFLNQEKDARNARLLRENEERYRLLADNTVDIIWKLDLDLVFAYVNPAVQKTLGYAPEELIGCSLLTCLGDEVHSMAQRALDTVRASLPLGSPYIGEVSLKTKDGRVVPIEILGTSYLDSQGRLAGLQGTSRDITERREAEQAMRKLNASLEQAVAERTAELAQVNVELAEANQAKTRFLRSMSHELRTPLNSVIGFSDILSAGLTGSLNSEQLKQVRLINVSGKHLLDLVNGILDLARIEAGREELHVERFDVLDLARDVTEVMQPQAAEKSLSLKLIDADEGTMLDSDRLKVRQILLDLIGNAVKYTDRGEVTLNVSATDDHVTFVVSDTGRGIAEDMQQHVFEEFVRRSDPDDMSVGTGLGLPIARALARALGGQLTVKSTVNEGSTFTLELPAGPAVQKEQ